MPLYLTVSNNGTVYKDRGQLLMKVKERWGKILCSTYDCPPSYFCIILNFTLTLAEMSLKAGSSFPRLTLELGNFSCQT